jgi:hypothetical protein
LPSLPVGFGRGHAGELVIEDDHHALLFAGREGFDLARAQLGKAGFTELAVVPAAGAVIASCRRSAINKFFSGIFFPRCRAPLLPHIKLLLPHIRMNVGTADDLDRRNELAPCRHL